MNAISVRPSYMTAVVGLPIRRTHPLARFDVEELHEIADFAGLELEELASLDAEELAGLFDAIGKAFKSVGKAVGDAASSLDKAYVSVTPRWLRKGLGIVAGPAKLAVDATDNIIHGQRIDKALLGAVSNQVEIFKNVGPIAQLGLSFIPGVGQGVSAAIGAALALADGKPITDALIAGVKGAIPGGPIVQRAVAMGVQAVSDVAQGKRIDTIALNALRSQIPGGKAALAAFDTGLALAQGKKIQDAGLAGVKDLLPNHPLAEGAFALTKMALAGKPIPGAPTKPGGRPVPASKPAARAPLRVRSAPKTYDAGGGAHDWGSDAGAPAAAHVAPANTNGGLVLPIALGAVALAAAGGGAWWFTRDERRTKS